MTLARQLAEVAHATGRARFSAGQRVEPIARRRPGHLQPPRCHAGAGHGVSAGRHAVLGDLCWPCLVPVQRVVDRIMGRQISRSG